MGRLKCMICDDKAACRAVDEELGKGGSGAFVARLMTFRGFHLSAQTVLDHHKHAVRAVPPGVAKNRKDFAIMVRDRAAQMFEADPDNPDAAPQLDLANKDHVPGITAGLKAQAEINKQANKSDDRKTGVAIAMILSGATSGGPPAHLLVGDGLTIDGEFEEVDPLALVGDDDPDE